MIQVIGIVVCFYIFVRSIEIHGQEQAKNIKSLRGFATFLAIVSLFAIIYLILFDTDIPIPRFTNN